MWLANVLELKFTVNDIAMAYRTGKPKTVINVNCQNIVAEMSTSAVANSILGVVAEFKKNVADKNHVRTKTLSSIYYSATFGDTRQSQLRFFTDSGFTRERSEFKVT